MKTTLISIGNSRGIRIPKPLIEQCGLKGEIELEVRDNTLVIHSPKNVRAGWANAFEQMAIHGDDVILDEESKRSDWDEEEWEWK